MKTNLLKVVYILILWISTSLNINAQPYFPIRVDNLWGIIDSTGRVVIRPSYDEFYVYGDNNNFIAARLDDFTYLINSQLQVVAKTNYSAIISAGEGIFETRLYPKTQYPNLYGLIDSTGTIIVEPKFTSIGKFSGRLAKVMVYTDTTISFRGSDKHGIINTNGDWIVQPEFISRHLKPPSSGLITFYQQDKGWGIMDSKGKIVVNPKYKWLGPVRNGLMEFKLDGVLGSGLMRVDETIIFPVNGTSMISYHPQSKDDSLVVVHTLKLVNNILGYTYLDSKIFTLNGEYLFEAKYGSECSHQCNGYFSVSDDTKKQGMMNSMGDIIVEPKYEVLQWCQKGLKQVKKDNKWGFINNSGIEVIPCIYDDTDPFHIGLARIYIGGSQYDYIFPEKYPNVKMGYINRDGEIIWEPSS